jgi:hypothetical protein
MGQCYGKAASSSSRADRDDAGVIAPPSPLPANGTAPQTPPRRRKSGSTTPVHQTPGVAWPSPYPAGGASPLPARSTPRRFFKRPFPPPSPAKHIKATLAKRLGGVKPKEGTIPEEGAAGPGGGGADAAAEAERPLDKTFGFGKNFGAKYELGKEVGRGHFGHTCSAVVTKGDYKGHTVAVKIISKAKVRATLEIMLLLSNLTFGYMHIYIFEILNVAVPHITHMCSAPILW